MNEAREIVERKQDALDDQIRSAQERQGRGAPGAVVELEQLRGQRSELKNELRRASNKDYRLNRKRRLEIRSKFEKIADAIRGELK